MVSANSQEEPSMEEILASIRRIISDDEDPAAAKAEAPKPEKKEEAAAAPAPAPEPAPVPGPTPKPAKKAEAPPPPPPPPSPAPAAAPVEDVLDLTEKIEEDDAPAAPPPPPAAAPAPVPRPPSEPFDSDIIGDAAARASTDKFAEFAKITAPKGTPLGNAYQTVEELVKELLRPHLKKWLDENLPILVERLVRAEIERIAREGEDTVEK